MSQRARGRGGTPTFCVSRGRGICHELFHLNVTDSVSNSVICMSQTLQCSPYIHMYIRTYICTYIRTYLLVCSPYMHVYIHTCGYSFICTYVLVSHTCKCMFKCMYVCDARAYITHIHTNIHISMHKHVHVHTFICTYTHTHTHALNLQSIAHMHICIHAYSSFMCAYMYLHNVCLHAHYVCWHVRVSMCVCFPTCCAPIRVFVCVYAFACLYDVWLYIGVCLCVVCLYVSALSIVTCAAASVVKGSASHICGSCMNASCHIYEWIMSRI